MVNHKKIKDMMSILTDFDNLTKAFDKAKKVVDAEGKPRFYLKCLVELEDFVSEVLLSFQPHPRLRLLVPKMLTFQW